MGLDIYFEKRKRDFDFSGIDKLRKQRKEIDKQISDIIGSHDGSTIYNVVWKLINGEDVRNEPIATVELAQQIVPLQKEYERIENEIDEANPRKQVAYFRKVNLLMVFFHYDGNCEYRQISREQVEDLVDRCKQVLANHDLAEELLPTTSGFFFGSTDYDEWYYRDVESVRDTFESILSETDWGTEVVEMYCWW